MWDEKAIELRVGGIWYKTSVTQLGIVWAFTRMTRPILPYGMRPRQLLQMRMVMNKVNQETPDTGIGTVELLRRTVLCKQHQEHRLT